MKQTKRGFTLIELLVVISIIGLLSSVVLSALNSARSKARDAQRVHDLSELRKALALYYDKNGSYPDTGGVEYSSALSSPSWNSAGNPLYVLVTQGFLPQLPVDPKNTPADNILQNTAADYSYYYSTGWPLSNYRTTYDLVTRLENAGNPSSCASRGGTYCHSPAWGGWDWQTQAPDGGKIVEYYP